MDETCRSCEDPDYGPEEHLDWLVDTIETFGWAVQWIEPDGPRGPFAYTVGLTAHGLPEFVLTGMGSHDSATLLNTAAATTMSGLRLAPGDRWEPEGFPAFEALAVATPDAHLLGACAIYGPAVRGLQLVYGDDERRWPWDRGHRPLAWRQYLLGPREAPAGRPITGS